MGKPPLLVDFIYTRACKPICAKLLILPCWLTLFTLGLQTKVKKFLTRPVAVFDDEETPEILTESRISK